jgi:hypothetical protein
VHPDTGGAGHLREQNYAWNAPKIITHKNCEAANAVNVASTAFALTGVKMHLPDATGGFCPNEKPADRGPGGEQGAVISLWHNHCSVEDGLGFQCPV